MRRYLPLALLLALPAIAQTPDRTQLLLEKLANAPGPPGFEDPVRAIMVPEMKPFVTTPITYDGMGSVIAQQGITGPRIMIDAHMDELGGMSSGLRPDGRVGRRIAHAS